MPIFFGKKSQLTFWHGEPKISEQMMINSIGPYYMLFDEKAEYNGFKDGNGIPMLNYQGSIGLQYNPIAIAQWGLGNYNKWVMHPNDSYYEKFIKSANWLTSNLEDNQFGLKVWNHKFDFEYRDLLKSPWYSGLAQGQGISLLVRAYKETQKQKYKIAAFQAFEVFTKPIRHGGVSFTDKNGLDWIEEYIVDPPTHILNGFIWGLWGVYDFALMFNDKNAMALFEKYTKTITLELRTYDTGFWSLYEHSGTYMNMLASNFYHKLHIVQLRIMYLLTSIELFNQFAIRWESYSKSSFYKIRAQTQKGNF